MLGLMQDWPLTVDKILDHAAEWHGGREVVSRSVEGPDRADHLRRHPRPRQARLQRAQGPGNQDRRPGGDAGLEHRPASWRPGTAIMGIGAVCHTLNPRLFPEQLCYIINHAEDRIIVTDLHLPADPDRAPRRDAERRAHRGADRRDHMQRQPCRARSASRPWSSEHAADCPWGGFDENTAAGLCYTSGTTGNPKGVLYSHRTNFLHTLVTLQTDVMGLSSRDVVLPVVPMFHANAWGLAFSVPGGRAARW